MSFIPHRALSFCYRFLYSRLEGQWITPAAVDKKGQSAALHTKELQTLCNCCLERNISGTLLLLCRDGGCILHFFSVFTGTQCGEITQKCLTWILANSANTSNVPLVIVLKSDPWKLVTTMRLSGSRNTIVWVSNQAPKVPISSSRMVKISEWIFQETTEIWYF